MPSSKGRENDRLEALTETKVSCLSASSLTALRRRIDATFTSELFLFSILFRVFLSFFASSVSSYSLEFLVQVAFINL